MGRPERERCPNRNRYVRIEDVDSAVLDRVLPFLESDGFVRDLENQLDALVAALDGAQVADEIEELHRALEETRQEIRGVIRDRARTDDPTLLELHEEVLTKLSAEAMRIEEQISAYETRRVSLAEARKRRDHLVAGARKVVAVFRQLPVLQRKSILSGLIEAVRYDPAERHATVELRLRP